MAEETTQFSIQTQRDLLRRAYEVSTKSIDPSTQIGAVVGLIDHASPDPVRIVAEDYNRFPHALATTPERLNDKDLKRKYQGHAERNAIIGAQRKRKSFDFESPTILVCPWACCIECAKYILETGVSHVLAHKQALERPQGASAWLQEIPIAHSQLREANISIIMFDGEVGGPPVRHGGELWKP